MRNFSSVPFSAVSIEGAFWRERLETVLASTIPSQHEQLERHGLLESLTIPQPPPPLRIPVKEHGISTQIFWDSDVGKWVEAASYALAHRRDATVEAQIEQIADWLARAQLQDGYLNCWYIGRGIDRRWSNLRDCHELYCAGHLLEGAVAYYQATGRQRLLDVLLRYVDHIARTFGPGPGQRRGYCGHPEIELALVKLYHLTQDRRHLALAAYFVDERGRQPPHYFDQEAITRGDDPRAFWFRSYEYNQSHKPVREQAKVVGHAVRAMYLYAAMADLAADLSDESLRRACEVLWRDVTSTRMYVTAGLGPAAANEGFTQDYDLPNDTAYAETCASVALAFWAQRMLNLDCDSAYADVMEQALYNGALAGLSREGTHYFYQNPLESDGSHCRWEWHPCPCCTMNVARLIASVGGYFYSAGEAAIAVHLYGGSTARLATAGQTVRLRQHADYPWSGRIGIEIAPEREAEFTLKLRIPGWARTHALTVNGMRESAAPVRGYVDLRRRWRQGDTVTLDLPMPIERLYAHPDVRADAGRTCLKRGPLVYCVEQADNPAAPIGRLRLPRTAALRAVERPDLLGGVVAIEADAALAGIEDWNGALYRAEPAAMRPATLTAIPYYIWNNRGPNRMAVWLAE